MTIFERLAASPTRNRMTKRAAGHLRSHLWYTANKKRHIDHMARYQKKNRARLHPSRRSMILKSRYGIVSAEYEAMLSAQGFACAICRKPSDKNRNGKLFVDHDHETGRVRGLLCDGCNRAIASLTADQLRAAISYLEGERE